MSGDSAANLPYAAKYLKDHHTYCSKCHGLPTIESMVLGVREFCNVLGHVTDKWYHPNCFFTAMKQKGVGVDEASIRGMSWLKWDDQESVRAQIEAFNNQSSGSSHNLVHLSSCKAEHAKSGRGKCGTCKESVKEGEAKYFCKGAYHHLGCFFRAEVVFVGSLEMIQGYAGLKQEAKDALKEAMDTHKSGKKVKTEVKAEANTGEGDAQSTDDFSMDVKPKTLKEGGVDPLLEAARKMAQAEMNPGLLDLSMDTSMDERAGTSAMVADDDEIQLVDVVKSDKPPVVTIGAEEMKPIQPPPAKPKSSLNALFDKYKKAGKSSSLSSVMEESLVKKPRLEEDMGKEELNEQLKKQADALWVLCEQFERVRDQDMIELMRVNDMYEPKEHDKIVMSLADAALFGAPGQCPKCPDGRLAFNSDLNTYACMGNVSEWTKCTHTSKNPTRCTLGIPRSLNSKLERVVDTGAMNSMTRRFYPAASGVPMRKIVPSVEVSAEHMEHADGGMRKVNQMSLIQQRMINPGAAPTTSAAGKQFIKRGTVVDGECEYASVSHVHKDEEGTLYSCSLTQADMGTNRNSYYKMQLLQHDMESDRFYVFKSWGRVGTNLGDCETHVYTSLAAAKKDFHDTFTEKTGNEWADKKYFRKRAGMMAMVDLDYEIEQSKDDGCVEPGSMTTLAKPIQQLIMRIFDEDMFKSALKSFDLDMDQMPLGKLSKRQLDLAYGVLNELQQLVAGPAPDRGLLIDACNRFYSLIPHNFGHRPPEMLDNKEIIEKKSKLIENLMEIAIAVDLMKGDKGKMNVSSMDPIDVNYLKLKSEITVLPKSSPDYQMIEKYAKNTHGSTHGIKIQITDIFCVNRQGEESRFKQGLGNRMLLWHGSRLSNFVGIISQGLRIAPPEAPHAGYMFGKGIYFADMISKSANYCHPDLSSNDAFLLLCDVALGSVQEEHNATSVNPLKGGHTAVKGMGYQVPDPSAVFNHPDGFVVPYGKATRGVQRIYLEYNEYIVYDVAQVNIRYLVRAKINFR